MCVICPHLTYTGKTTNLKRRFYLGLIDWCLTPTSALFQLYHTNDKVVLLETIYQYFTISVHLTSELLKQVSVHMAKQFQRRRFFRNRPIRNKNCMWWPCLLTDRDEMSKLHRGHSIDASYQVSVVAMLANRSGRNEQSSQRTFHT